MVCMKHKSLTRIIYFTAKVYVDVSVLEALDVIFEVQKKSGLSQILLNEDNYVICWTCCCVLTQLYRLFIEFTDISDDRMFMKSITVQNKELKSYQELISKYIPKEELKMIDFENVALNSKQIPRPDADWDDGSHNISKYCYIYLPPSMITC